MICLKTPRHAFMFFPAIYVNYANLWFVTHESTLANFWSSNRSNFSQQKPILAKSCVPLLISKGSKLILETKN